MSDLGERLVDAIRADFPGSDPNERPVHTAGIGAEGWFQASDAAARFSIAEHFQGGKVPVTVRFSNGAGVQVEHDRAQDVRGMAVRFHLGEVTRDEHGLLHGARECDLVAMTLPVFFVSTPEAFFDFCRAGRPVPVKRHSGWDRLLAKLKLELPPDDPPPDVTESGNAGLLAYAHTNPEAATALVAMATIVTPSSYVRAAYHAVHAFRLVDPEGRIRHVRFTWEPVAGVNPQQDLDEASQGPDRSLQAELRRRLQAFPAQMLLRAQVAEAGDDVTDPTTPWPDTRPRLQLGVLTITRVVDDQVHGCERIAFNPTRLVPGLECSDDPVLLARRWAYEASGRQRHADGYEVTP